MALNLRHQTPAEFAARYWSRVRSAYASGDKARFVRLLWWLEQRLVAGDITDTQARVSFNAAYGRSLTAGQWTTFRTTRIQPAASRYDAIQAEADL